MSTIPSAPKPNATPQRVLTIILAHVEVAPHHFRLTLHAPAIARQARAGHYVHLLARSKAASDPLLRRAFSILAVEGETISILYRVEGRGTAHMAHWRPDDVVDAIGPLGVPFAPLAPHALLVGGGVGVPPLSMLASQYAVNPSLDQQHHVVALIGARTKNELLCLGDFERYGVEYEVATDDGSAGCHGLVTHLLEKRLRHDQRDTELPTVYSCGPLPMLRSVAALCERYHVACQVSLEENMPCGVGVCNGCVVPVTGAGDDYGRYRRICVEGPVLWAHEVDWSHYPRPASCH